MLQRMTEQVSSLGQIPVVKAARSSYFDKDALVGEIVALLSIRQNPLMAGEIDQMCPSSPEQQATSDTLRWMKRKGLVRMRERKTWSLCDGVCPDKKFLDAVYRVHENLSSKGKEDVDMDLLMGRIIEALRIAFGQHRHEYMTFDQILEAVGGAESIRHHKVSQALDKLVNVGPVLKLGDRRFHYLYNHAYFERQPSLFDLPPGDEVSSFSAPAPRVSVPVECAAADTVIMEGSVLSAENGLQTESPFVTGMQNERVFEPVYNTGTDMVDDEEQTESDRRKRKMRIRRRVLVAQTRIKVQVRRRHKVSDE